MDPWQPLRCSSGDNDVAASASVTLPPVFPQFVQRKAMDSAQYLSIIGEIKTSLIALTA